MLNKLQSVLSKPFLLIQIGDYGCGYETMPIPPGLISIALERQYRGEKTYPTNHALPPPHFHVPADVHGILMNKTDELRINGFAYWAQKLVTCISKRNCINSSMDELLRFADMMMGSYFWAVFVTKTTKTEAPKGNAPGRVFMRWDGRKRQYVCELPTGKINTDIVYTEAKKDTLIFKSLEPLQAPEPIDLSQYHLFFTPSGGLPHDMQYKGKRLPYRSSNLGTCSLLVQGRPDTETDTGIPLLKQENRTRRVVALASIHPHVCGRVFA